MTIKEANRLSVLHQIDKKLLSIKAASEELKLSVRQTKRLRRRFKAEGASGLISKRRGLASAHRLPIETRNQAMEILKNPLCKGWGPTFAKEKLEVMHAISISRETVRHWMIEEGLWKAKGKKKHKVYQRRTRRAQFGELLQGDASHHAWFEERGEKCALLIFVDDATSAITSGRFFEAETTEGYLRVLEHHLKTYGKPGGLYVDKHSVFRVNHKNCQGEKETHFGKVLRELDIELICAHSPQAKGRVERANETLQDRLIKEMRLLGIKSIEEGNEFLPEFIRQYNEKFGKEAMDHQDGHRPLRGRDDLERIFARKTTRKLSKNLTFQYEKELYQIKTDEPNRIRKTHAEVIERLDKPVVIEIGGKIYEYEKWEDTACKRAPIVDAKMLETWPIMQRRKPGRNHPWRSL